MKKMIWVLLLIPLLTTSCIFGPSTKKAVSYRPGRVYLSDRQIYKVGELQAPWRRQKVKAYSIAFYNPETRTTIATDAFCGPAYEDLPLPLLTSHMLAGVQSYKIVDQYEFMLDGRGALRSKVVGSVDGVPLSFDVVVLKKNKCIIDFMAVAPKGDLYKSDSDFEYFYSGFHYEDTL